MLDHKFFLYGKDADYVQRVKIYYQESHFSQRKVEYNINVKSWALYMKKISSNNPYHIADGS